MKIAITMLIRDAIDILPYWVDYHMPKADLIIITDNNSVDGTKEFLQDLSNKGQIIFIEEPDNNFQQGKWIARMINLARDRYGIEWVINSDSDEFWRGDLRAEIERYDSEGYNAIFIDSWQFFPTYRDDLNEKNPVIRLQYRKKVFDKWPKVMNSTKDFLSIPCGNDDITFLCDKKSIKSTSCFIYHYSHRSFEHCRLKYSKYAQSAINESERSGIKVPSEWYRGYGFYKEGEEALYQFYKQHMYAESEADIERLVLVHDKSLAEEIRK